MLAHEDNDWDCDDICSSEHANLAAQAEYCSPQRLNLLRDEVQRYFFTDTAKHSYSKKRWPEKPRVWTSCPIVDTHDIFRSVDVQRPLVTTAIIATLQKRCQNNQGCIWENSDLNISLVNIDQFEVGSLPEIWEDGKHVHQANLTGFVSLPDGSECVIPCDPSDDTDTPCRQSLPHWNTYPRCKGCFNRGGVDFMPLRTLLAAANISLDGMADGTRLPRRFWGSLLRVHVEYSNQKDLWTSFPPELRMRYTYIIRQHRSPAKPLQMNAGKMSLESEGVRWTMMDLDSSRRVESSTRDSMRLQHRWHASDTT